MNRSQIRNADRQQDNESDPLAFAVATALVTNAGSPAGRVCALALARRGYRIVAADPNGDAANRTADAVGDVGGSCRPIVVDTDDPADWRRVLPMIEHDHDRVDVLINVLPASPFVGLFELAADDCHPVDIRGLVSVCRGVARRWISAERPGRVITVVPPLTTPGAVSAGTIAAATMFTECLHLEIRRYGCSATLVQTDLDDLEGVAAEVRSAIDSPRRPPITRQAVSPLPLPSLPLRPRRGSAAPRLVVITGAGSGIGRATALRFGAAGSTVIASDIDARSAEATSSAVRDAGGRANAYRLDVTDVDAFAAFADRVRTEHGTPDVLVNNAGIGILGEIVDTSDSAWARIAGINLLGMVHGTRIFGAQMADDSIPGHIINVASAAAYLPMALLASYSTTKAAVKAFTDAARPELAQHGIGASVICPGPIATNIFASAIRSDDAQTADLPSVTAAALDRLSALHVIPGADTVARAIESAVSRSLDTVLVRPESYGVYALRISAPAVLRALSGTVCNQRNVGLLFQAGRSRIAARAFGIDRPQ